METKRRQKGGNRVLNKKEKEKREKEGERGRKGRGNQTIAEKDLRRAFEEEAPPCLVKFPLLIMGMMAAAIERMRPLKLHLEGAFFHLRKRERV